MTALTVLGRIHTLSPEGPGVASAALVADGVIVGTQARRGELSGDVLDFGERTILPGFIDPHAHLEVSARGRATMADVRVPRCESVPDVLDVLRDAISAGVHGEGWLEAQANLFFNMKLRERRYPTLAELDSVSASVPIVIHAGGHTSLLNSAAIDHANLGRFAGNTKGAMGGAIVELDERGHPTGVVSEIDSLLPIVHATGLDLDAVLAGGADALFTQYGVTVVGDISGSSEGVRRTAELVESGRIKQRIEVFVCAPGTVGFEAALDPALLIPRETDRIRVHGIKVFSDGGFSSKNAAVHTPYRREHALRPGSRGRVNLGSRQLSSMIRQAAGAGLQLAVHANGERAQDAVVRAALDARSRQTDIPSVRVEHAGNLLTQREALDGWRESGICAMPQPVFLYNFGDFFPEYLGPVAKRGRFPLRSLREAGFKLSASSDVYTGAEERQTNPFFGIWCATERRTFLDQTVETDEAISFDDALLMYTRYAAESLSLGDRYGSIDSGKAADFVVLDRDPFRCSGAELLDVQVDHVVIGGALAYSRPGAMAPIGGTPANGISK